MICKFMNIVNSVNPRDLILKIYLISINRHQLRVKIRIPTNFNFVTVRNWLFPVEKQVSYSSSHDNSVASIFEYFKIFRS